MKPKQKPLTTLNLAILNLRAGVSRTAVLIFVAASLSFSLFAGTIISQSLSNGLEIAKSRLGADIAVIPFGYETQYEGIILSGQPTVFYFNKSIEARLAEIEGIEQATGQFYLTSISADCCSVPVQIIGIDPETDFVTMPWITNVYSKGLNDGQLIIGSDIITENNGTLTFYGTIYEVAAQLEKSSTGMDYSVFVTQNTARQLAAAARALGRHPSSDIFAADIDNHLSVVFLKIAAGYDAGEAAAVIRREIPDISVIRTKNIFAGLSEQLTTLNFFTSIISVLVWILAIVILSALYSFGVNARKKEFAVLRLIGATRQKVIRIVLTESFGASALGSIAGLSLAALTVFPFSAYIGNRLGMPFILPGIMEIAVLLAVSLGISLTAGILSAVFAAFRISGAETYITLREGE